MHSCLRQFVFLSPQWVTHADFLPLQAQTWLNTPSPPATNTCFYFTASECTALGKNLKPQLLYIVLQFSKQALGHGPWPFSSHREEGSPRVQPLYHTGQQNPDPVTHACDMSRHRLIWSYSNSHLLHLAYDRATRTMLKPVLDWALKSSKVCKSGLGGRQCFAQPFPPPRTNPEQRKHCAMIISLIFTGTETHFYCPSHRTRPAVPYVSAKSSQVPRWSVLKPEGHFYRVTWQKGELCFLHR